MFTNSVENPVDKVLWERVQAARSRTKYRFAPPLVRALFRVRRGVVTFRGSRTAVALYLRTRAPPTRLASTASLRDAAQLRVTARAWRATGTVVAATETGTLKGTNPGALAAVRFNHAHEPRLRQTQGQRSGGRAHYDLLGSDFRDGVAARQLVAGAHQEHVTGAADHGHDVAVPVGRDTRQSPTLGWFWRRYLGRVISTAGGGLADRRDRR